MQQMQHKNKLNSVQQQYPILGKGQSGITLVVVMVILIAMTFLGLGAMQDSSMQLSMLRNVQLQNHAHSSSLSEINAQIDLINSNDPAQIDQTVLNVIQASEETIDDLTARQVDMTGSLLLPDILDLENGDDRFTQSLTLTEPDTGFTPLVEGYSIDPDSPVTWIYLEFDSSVQITNTSSRSDQTQGFRYISANFR